MRVGIEDPLSNLARFTSDHLTGAILAVSVDYVGIPSIRKELDPFGRVWREYVAPQAGVEARAVETPYQNGGQPYVERWERESLPIECQGDWTCSTLDR